MVVQGATVGGRHHPAPLPEACRQSNKLKEIPMRHLAAFLTVGGLSVVGPSEAVAQSNSGLEMAKPESVGIPPNVFSTLDTRCNALSTMVLGAGTVTHVARRGRVHIHTIGLATSGSAHA